ncbi:ATP-binding cassette domain-containing protein [Mucilaginibacter myungsuensis]|uniref:ATP-binding cassette domain-containing protein n=1 Tax=Mucilaginibacter myungsuensis TaxID=649104 RepID=A0A929PXB2_9SPHI|nr:ATP-binding cassette domain-containing protein [Mucilaginibacter myungsuensis]MBE9663678.1 ATP-binding cassette domain-containing protein [Mucilaginibacter myungsuensis]MDN3598998.1 ATP-binding cassette domain-containing protein [Mucilaginibacter myungsuensis]
MVPLSLKADSITLEFKGRKILQDVHIDCQQGEIVGLLGRNGCGKSSLLKIIFGTLKPIYKYVGINGEVLQDNFSDRRIAYLPQHNYLPKGLKVDEVARLMVGQNQWGNFERQPGYTDYKNKRTDQLSGGELRRLEMLMVLYSPADFLLLDEPFTHISPVMTDWFKEQLLEARKTKGIIVTDHQYLNIIDVSDRIVLLNNGVTKPIVDPKELMQYGYVKNI